MSTTTTTTTVSSTTVQSSASSTQSYVTNSTTTNSSPTTELSTTTTNNATLTTPAGPHTIQPGSDGLTAAVIALCIVCALLVIAVIILSCCLYSRCREQHTDDAEQASSDRKLLITMSSESLKNKTITEESREIINNIPPLSTTGNVACIPKTIVFPQVMSSNVGCQTNNLRNSLKHSEFACQVNIMVPKDTTYDAICQTDDAEPMLTKTDFECQVEVIKAEVAAKAVSTDLTVTPTIDYQSQTPKVRFKHKKIQCDQSVSLNALKMRSAYSQTHEQENQTLLNKSNKTLLDTVDEKNAYPRAAEKDVFVHSEPSLPAKMKKRRIKKKKVHIADDKPVESEREETNYHYDVHEVRTEIPVRVQIRSSNAEMQRLSSDFTEEGDIKDDVNETKQIHVPPEQDSIQDFAEEKEDSDDMPEVVKRKLKIQRVLVQSFFAQERRDNQVEKALFKKYTKMRSKKKLKA